MGEETQSCCSEKQWSLSSSPGFLRRKAHKASLAALVSQMAILATEFLSSPALNLGQAFAWYNRPALEKSLAVFLRDSEHWSQVPGWGAPVLGTATVGAWRRPLQSLGGKWQWGPVRVQWSEGEIHPLGCKLGSLLVLLFGGGAALKELSLRDGALRAHSLALFAVLALSLWLKTDSLSFLLQMPAPFCLR